MTSLIMLAIIAGCVALLYLKGTLVMGVSMVLNAMLAGFVALAFCEMLSRLLINYSPAMAAWALMTCFLLLFVLAFAVFQTVAMQIGKEKIDFGKLAEQIGRVLCGVVLGYVITGQLLVAAAMAPLPAQYPHPRFEERNPNPSQPNKPLLSPDGLVVGLFGTVSKGSFSAIGSPRSFAVLHPDFLDQLYLNRLKKDVPSRTSQPAISVERNAVWYAPDNLRDSDGKPLSPAPGDRFLLVRAGIRKRALKDAGKFTLAQVRLICGPRNDPQKPLAGQGQAVYPTGYIGAERRLVKPRSLAEVITIESSDVQGDVQTIDLAFSVPSNLSPLLLAFKGNNVVQLSGVADEEDAPQPLPFGATAPPQARTGSPANENRPAGGGPERSRRDGGRDRRPLNDISRSVVGPAWDEN